MCIRDRAFVTYMTAGLPDMEGTKALIKAQDEAGIDIIAVSYTHLDVYKRQVR